MRLRLLLVSVAVWVAVVPPAEAQTQNPLPIAGATFGDQPAANWQYALPWDLTHFRVGVEFTNSSRTYANEFGVGLYGVNRRRAPGTADYFTGALYVYQLTEDPSEDTKAKASNAITAYSAIASGNPRGFAEALLAVASIEPGGDGRLLGAEIGIDNQGVEYDGHCDAGVPPCKAGIWLANYGPRAGSWMIDAGRGGGGWLNGISMQAGTIRPGGKALAIPDKTYITVGDAPLIYVDSGRTYLYGDGGRWVEVGDLVRRLEALERRRR